MYDAGDDLVFERRPAEPIPIEHVIGDEHGLGDLSRVMATRAGPADGNTPRSVPAGRKAAPSRPRRPRARQSSGFWSK